MKKLFITGASGFLGWNLCAVAKTDWSLYGTMYSRRLRIPGAQLARLDLTDYRDVKQAMRDVRPDAVIHTAAISDANYCQEHRAESRRINVDVSVNLAGLCADLGIPYLFTSSDLVFNGEKAPYNEDAPVCPISLYGEQKVTAESEILRCNPQARICRMALMFGDPGPVAKSFLQPLIQALESGQPARSFTDEFRTPLSGASAAAGILLALAGSPGILHLGGCDRISRYDFARLVVDVGRFKNANLLACSQADVAMAAPRPQDVALDTQKASKLGFQPLPVEDELKQLECLKRQ